MIDKTITQEMLHKVGFGCCDPSRFFAKNIVLRDGRDAVLWEDKLTGHGILDQSFWEDDDYYSEEYREEFTADIGKQIDALTHFKIHQELNKRQYQGFAELLDKESKFLEIGCSYGGILDLVLKAGTSVCHAVEPNKKDAQFIKDKYGEKITIFNQIFENVVLQDNYYDLIISFEVLEHVVNPKKFISYAVSKLKRHGTLYLEVPNHNDALLQICQNAAYNKFYYHKAHIHYFTADSINQMCSSCGLKGKTSGFQMYPFFNQVYWLFNNKPQGAVDVASSIPNPCVEISQEQKALHDFYQHVCLEYEKLADKHNMCDCLIFRGIKR